jgi:hypothetical protein
MQGAMSYSVAPLATLRIQVSLSSIMPYSTYDLQI